MKILKFYADWCTPCKLLSQVISEVESNIPVTEINVDTNRDTAVFFGVRTIPTLLLLDDNDNIVKRHNGGLTTEGFTAFIKG